MTVVVGASVVVAGLASADATGQWAESVLGGEPLAAPHLMPAEAASIAFPAYAGARGCPFCPACPGGAAAGIISVEF